MKRCLAALAVVSLYAAYAPVGAQEQVVLDNIELTKRHQIVFWDYNDHVSGRIYGSTGKLKFGPENVAVILDGYHPLQSICGQICIAGDRINLGFTGSGPFGGTFPETAEFWCGYFKYKNQVFSNGTQLMGGARIGYTFYSPDDIVLPEHSYSGELVSFQAPFVFEAIISVSDHCDLTLLDSPVEFHLFGKGVATVYLRAFQTVSPETGLGISAYYTDDHPVPLVEYNFAK